MSPAFRAMLRPFAGPARRARAPFHPGDCPACDIGIMEAGRCPVCGYRAGELVFAELDPERRSAA